MKLGSLFDGSGGFPLAGSLCGIEPVFASEVEPYPISVTKSRFPNMKHLGSVTDIHGGDIEPVDIITFGSPCQDLSVAGKRAGLKHEANGDDETTRSGLFMEAVRIIKEMRKATNGEYPTFAVWENVPGAFSSNKGEDFRTVLEELIKIVEPTAVMPAVPKNGWPYADSYCGDGWSLAYRVFDAQYWGVPQRRRRIYLVLDLRGQRAGKVSFEREGVRGNFETFKTAGQGTAGDAADRTGADDCEREGNCLTPWDCQSKRVYSADGVFPTLYSGENAGQNQQSVCVEAMETPENCKYQADGYCKKIRGDSLPFLPYCIPYTMKIRSGCEGECVAYSFDSLASNSMKSKNPHSGCRRVEIAKTLDTTDPNPSKNQGGIAIVEPVPYTLKICDENILDDQGGQQITVRTDGKAPTLRAETHGNLPCVLEAAGFKAGQSMAGGIGWQEECAATLAAQCSGTEPTVCVKCYDARGNGDGETVSTLTGDHENRITDYTNVVVEESPVYCLQGNGIDRADTAGCNGKGWKEGTSYTLNTIDRPAVVYCTDIGFFNSQEEVAPTLLARQYKDPHLVSYPENAVQYIVRRLTPTECARLQGFPDDWGHPDHKEDFTDEEYRFWLNVRNTHAAINGKPQKDYTKAQMLTWYNKLHTDSAEYKMWGNGISLPTALYVMQGIAEELKGGEG